jgi:hypothetical protein
MNELKDTKPTRPLETLPGQDAAGLGALCNFINDPALTDPNYDPSVRRVAPSPAPVPTPKPKPVVVQQPQSPIIAHFNGQKIFYTGRLAAGKDFVAERSGAMIFGFADPMYAVASHFFGVEVTATKNKDLPGMRTFLQILGQWGKGIVSEQYPYTPTRACFITMIRSLGALGKLDPSVEWENYGKKDSLWTDSLVKRAATAPADRRVAATNARFDVEFNALQGAGWTHFHVLCSPKTWEKRLAAKKLTPASKELADVSEQMATKMDRGITHMLSTDPKGPKIRCVWNDDAPCPSPRLFTLNEFLQEVSINHTLEVTSNMAAE